MANMSDYGRPEDTVRAAYDSPMAAELQQDLKDPHLIMEMIREMDGSIARAEAEKRRLVSRYQELMKGYEEHFHAVMNGPQESPVEGFGPAKFGF